VCLYVLKKRENAHISIYVHKNRVTTKEKKTKSFPFAVRQNVLEMKLDFYAHEKKMKQTNRRLFIGNNNKDPKKKKTSLCIYCKKIIRKKNIRTWFILNPYWQFHLH
jgi:hypothetical protein